MTRILHPEPVHHCEPNWRLVGNHFEGTDLQWAKDGTMVECDCGKLLVAWHPRYSNAIVRTASWRSASWRERRRFRRELK